MDRELLLEIGCEELPASWLPDLTRQTGDVLVAELKARRLEPDAPAATFSTPRRLTVCIDRLPDHQTDLEELITGPPVSAGTGPDGTPTQAAVGFATRQGADVAALERIETPKGTYLAYRRRQRGKAAVDVLPEVLGATLRGLKFPKLMKWDAMLEDGHGELLFGRPIRWLVFLYGGRVVPFAIARTPGAQSHQVQEVRTGASTYGHRFLATSGRAGGAVKVRSFEDYRARLLEHFVMLDRGSRHDKIARELEARARRLQGRVGRIGRGASTLLEEVPDLVEYPAVVAGTFSPDFLDLPEEVLRTTLIHHQHYFPVEGEDGRLKPAFLAVTNTEPDDERTIASNAERVVTARLRDARFFWNADRKVPLESRVDRLETLLFHRKLGSYKQKAERVSALAGWIAETAFDGGAAMAGYARTAGLLAKADLTTDMVREFTELQGTMGGIYAREEGQPEEVWKAIYFHYLPIAVEAGAHPSAAELGRAAVSWAAVSAADKLDTLVGLFLAGEQPTGSRDPHGMRRAAHGLLAVLVDLETVTGLRCTVALHDLLQAASAQFNGRAETDLSQIIRKTKFMWERLEYVLQRRGFSARHVRAVVGDRSLEMIRPGDEIKKLEVLAATADSPAFLELARAFKRVRNIGKSQDLSPFQTEDSSIEPFLTGGADRSLFSEVRDREVAISNDIEHARFAAAFTEAAKFTPAVDLFFKEVLVMDPNPDLRAARLRLLKRLERLVLSLADVSEIVSEE